MSLVFAAVTPHPPSLIPTIGKEAGLAALAQTKQALEQLEQDLYLAKPDVIVVISPHEGLFEDAFVVNAHTQYTADYAAFGDLATEETWKGTPDFASKISHIANNESSLPIRLVTEEKLSHGAAVPLHYLTAHLDSVKVLPVGFSGLTPDMHVNFGVLLKDVIMNTGKRVAVIASGDLSHCLSADAPAGLDERGAQVDKQIIDVLSSGDVTGLLELDAATVGAVQECAYRSLLVLSGIIQNMEWTFEQYAYEFPHGIGYLTGNIKF